jgi:RecA-family ATPase
MAAERKQMQDEHLSPEAIDSYEQMLLANLIVEPATGEPFYLINSDRQQTVQSGMVDRFIEHAKSPVALVVLDPLIFFHGSNENDNTAMTVLMNAAKKIAYRLGCAVLIVHHQSKAAVLAGDTSALAMRGASGIPFGARSVLTVSVASKEDVKDFKVVDDAAVARGDVLRVIHNKINDAAKSKDVWLVRNEHALSVWNRNPIPRWRASVRPASCTSGSSHGTASHSAKR